MDFPLLKQITYPTGGSLTYLYDQNRAAYINTSNEQVVGGVHVASTKLIDPASSNDCLHPLVTNYNYKSESTSASSLWGIEQPNNHIQNKSHYESEGTYAYIKIWGLGCDYDFKYPGILSKEQAISIRGSQEFMAIFSQVMDVVSGITSIINIVTLIANGTGVLAVVIDAIALIFNVILTCFPTGKDSNTDTFYNTDLNSINPLPAQYWRVEVVQGNGDIGKTIFEFTNPFFGTNTNALWQTTNAYMSSKQRFAYWSYGLPKKTIVLDKFGNKVKETENIYDFTKSKVNCTQANGASYTSSKCLVKKTLSQRNTDWVAPNLSYTTQADRDANYVNGGANEDLKADVYDIFTGRTELEYTYERVFDNNTSQMLETITKYRYNANNFQVNYIETTQSTGEKLYKEITYSCDYNTGVLNQLNQNNVIAAPVVTSIYLVKCSIQYVQNDGYKNDDRTNDIVASLGNNHKGPSIDESTDLILDNNTISHDDSVINCYKYYLSTTVTEYSVLTNGEIKPFRTLAERTDRPIIESQWQFYTSPTAALPTAFTEVQRFIYDNNGNLIGMKDEGGHVVSNIYGYDDKYVIASVINAETNVDKPAYTSFETATNFGGWTLNGAYSVSIGAITGTYSYPLTSGSLSANINSNKPYKLSVWAKTNSINVPNGTLVKSAPTINGYTYYEYDIAQGNTSVTVSGSAIIDELRLYPATARMRTVSYDPLIGKMSESDENNRLTYYEYDELGRMRFIKDDNKNIVKMYEYNTKKALGCNVTYTNSLVQEYITKTCGVGYVGTKVLYTVPAGKYTSTISQVDVDMQVQNEIDGQGQAYADNPSNGGQCLQIFYNDAMSQDFTKQCTLRLLGSVVTYSVPAGKYAAYGLDVYGVDAKTRVNKMALDEINANGQAYANKNGTCPVVTYPIWRAIMPSQVRCGTGNNAGRQEAYMQDVNPNSSSYGTYAWQLISDVDYNLCPVNNSTNVTTNNNTSTAFNITFTNVYNTNQTYSYAINASASNAIIAQIPFGTYNVTIYPLFNTNLSFTYIVNGYSQSGYGTLNWYNLVINSNNNFQVTIY